MAILLLETNYGCHKLILACPMKFELKQQPIVSMGILKNPKPNKEKKGKYEGIPSMNHLRFMKIDDHIDFLYMWVVFLDSYSQYMPSRTIITTNCVLGHYKFHCIAKKTIRMDLNYRYNGLECGLNHMAIGSHIFHLTTHGLVVVWWFVHYMGGSYMSFCDVMPRA